MTEKVRIGTATLYLGDAREALPRLRGVDALITDPPYGINFKAKHTKRGKNVVEFPYQDDEEHFRGTILPLVRSAIDHAGRSAIFTGKTRLQEYPPARDIGGVFVPNGGNLGSWGFCCLHPVLFYGKKPRLLGANVTRIALPSQTIIAQRNGHPCPKPIEYMLWLVNFASNPGERVLDPFMGSGTTGVACAQLGRRFVGIEIEPRYFEIACRRIEEAQKAAKRAANDNHNSETTAA